MPGQQVAIEIYQAVMNGDVGTVTQLLTTDGSLLHIRPKGGASLLHVAAQAGQKEIAEKLLPFGVGLEEKDDIGMTPLHVAAGCGQVEMVRFLLSRGAGPNAVDNDNMSALHAALGAAVEFKPPGAALSR